MGRKHYALRAILLILITEAITILPSVLLVPYEQFGGTVYFILPIISGLSFGVAILTVILGNQFYRQYLNFSLRFNLSNHEDIKFVPSKSYFISASISIVLCGIVGTVFNLFPLFSYIP